MNFEKIKKYFEKGKLKIYNDDLDIFLKNTSTDEIIKVGEYKEKEYWNYSKLHGAYYNNDRSW